MGVVAVGGNTSGDGAAKDLRGVELTVAGVRAGDKYPAHGIPSTVPEASFTQLEEARILAQHRGENRGGPEVFDDAVGESGSIAHSVTSRTLTAPRPPVLH